MILSHSHITFPPLTSPPLTTRPLQPPEQPQLYLANSSALVTGEIQVAGTLCCCYTWWITLTDRTLGPGYYPKQWLQ